MCCHNCHYANRIAQRVSLSVGLLCALPHPPAGGASVAGCLTPTAIALGTAALNVSSTRRCSANGASLGGTTDGAIVPPHAASWLVYTLEFSSLANKK